MVIKTNTCSFSEYRIYPGHGSRFVRRDGQLVVFLNSKVESLYHQKKKPAKLTWTLAWRRHNKKLSDTTQLRRRTRRAQKGARPIVGASLEDLKKQRRQVRPSRRTNRATKAAAKEVQARKK